DAADERAEPGGRPGPELDADAAGRLDGQRDQLQVLEQRDGYVHALRQRGQHGRQLERRRHLSVGTTRVTASPEAPGSFRLPGASFRQRSRSRSPIPIWIPRRASDPAGTDGGAGTRRSWMATAIARSMARLCVSSSRGAKRWSGPMVTMLTPPGHTLSASSTAPSLGPWRRSTL